MKQTNYRQIRPSVMGRKFGRAISIPFRFLSPKTASIFDKAGARYWQGLPLHRMSGVLLALFFTFSGTAFALDLLDWRGLPLWGVLTSAVLIGATAAAMAAIVLRRRFKLIPLLVVLALAANLVLASLPHGPPIPVTAAAHRRMVLDAVGILAATLVGYRFFMGFVSIEGVEQIRARAELEFAHEIQRTLVPAIDRTTDSLEVYGLSMPSEKVGGDLVDFVATEAGWLGCLADVSGHGIKAAVLMGNLKTALRLGLAEGHSLPVILDTTNRVLPAVKETEMYATVAAVGCTGGGWIEYSLAGHLPILHYRAARKLVDRCSMEQFPLGLMPECNYGSATVACEAGDMFALLSDGIVETEDASGLEFGLERIERLLTENGARPVKDIANKIMSELAAFGTPRDDQSLLLIRIAR
jgi:serine phosphatase RsbU (regulator of sigma subunit)